MVLVTALLVALAVLPGHAATQDPFDEGHWWMEVMRVPEAHEQATGEGVTIALLDGPVYLDAPELAGQDVAPAGSRCLPRPPGDDGPPSEPTGPASEDTAHTTAMAALLVGNGRGTRPDGRGVNGIAPDATVRTYMVHDHYRENARGERGLDCRYGERGDAEFLREVLADGPDVVLVTTDWAPRVQDVVNEGIEDGVIFVVSGGNTGPTGSMFGFTNLHGTVNVIAGGPDGALAEFNSQPWMSLYFIAENDGSTKDPQEAVALNPDQGGDGRPTVFAPGVDIATGGFSDGRWVSNYIGSGTSAAGTLVAGALALAVEKWPEAGGNQILQSLVRNANGDYPFGYDYHGGFGGISLSSLLAQDPAQYPDLHPYYGGLRWAMEDDPPPPQMYGRNAADDGFEPWRPTYAEDELDLPYPWGPLPLGEPTDPASVEPTTAPPATPTATADPADAGEAATPSDGPPWGLIAGAGALALLAVVAAVVRRRARQVRRG